MQTLKWYLKMIRVKNYIKNFLIFIPFIFSAKFLNFNIDEYLLALIGFCCFSFASSIIYIINDICDIEKDRNDERKKHRPIASGKISIRSAIITSIILFICICFGLYYINNIYVSIILFAYILLNLAYSVKLKNYPIIDITILSLFFLMRVFYGGVLFNAEVSVYLYLTTLSVAFYFGVGKRKKELESKNEVRDVLKKYPNSYLDSLLNIFLGTSMLYYSLWVINYQSTLLNATLLEISIFFVICILIYYHYILFTNKNGNPTDILLDNKLLILFVLIYCIVIGLAFIL